MQQAYWSEFSLSRHAERRLNGRRLGAAAVTAAMLFGREVHTRGATVRAIGRKEVARSRLDGIDLQRFEGIQIVCAPDGTVITCYRNRDFRHLRPKLGRRWRVASQKDTNQAMEATNP